MYVCMYEQYELLILSDLQFRDQTAKEELALLKKQAESAFGEVPVPPYPTILECVNQCIIYQIWTAKKERILGRQYETNHIHTG